MLKKADGEPDIRDQAGFTLIEVVVASAILVFLMASVWSTNSIRGSDFNVMVSQEKLRLLATKAKSLTINSVFGTVDPACGYGIRVEQKSAFIFLDRGACGFNNRRYDSGEKVPGSANLITPAEGIVFLPSTGTTAEVVFVPPYSETVINANANITEVNIEVRSPLGRSRRVIINNQGLINARN